MSDPRSPAGADASPGDADIGLGGANGSAKTNGAGSDAGNVEALPDRGPGVEALPHRELDGGGRKTASPRGRTDDHAASTGVQYSPHRRAQATGVHHLARRARERIVIGGYGAASAALARLSPRLTAPVARSLFVGGYYAWPAKRRIVLSNASHVLGLPADDRRVVRLARRIYGSYSSFALELMRLPSRPVEEPLQLVQTGSDQGAESFLSIWETCRSQGRGLIAVSGHIGSIEVFAAAFALRGVPTYGLADDTEYPELFARLVAMRKRRGVETIPWRNMRDVFRALRRPAVLGLVVDWGYRPEDVPVRLFDAWTTLPAGPATLAARTGSIILPVVNRRQADGTYVARHWEPIVPADDSPAALQAATQAIADALEAMIREAPEQWFSFKPMWPATAEEATALAARVDALPGRADAPPPADVPSRADAGDRTGDQAGASGRTIGGDRPGGQASASGRTIAGAQASARVEP